MLNSALIFSLTDFSIRLFTKLYNVKICILKMISLIFPKIFDELINLHVFNIEKYLKTY